MAPRRTLELHAHTTASDGVLEPSQLVQLALAVGLRLLAITDHDTTDGVPLAMAAAEATPLAIWPGVELSTEVAAGEIHILGYLLDHHDPELQATLAAFKRHRFTRAEQIVARLHDAGAPITFARVREIAGTGAIGRPHVAQALVEVGHVATSAEAFERYLTRGAPAYVPHARPTPVEAVRLVRRHKGVPVFAHPPLALARGAWDGTPDALIVLLTPLARELALAGLVGMEGFYPGFDEPALAALRELARRFGLIPTGGSDYHGREPIKAPLGSQPIPWETIQRLERARAKLLAG